MIVIGVAGGGSNPSGTVIVGMMNCVTGEGADDGRGETDAISIPETCVCRPSELRYVCLRINDDARLRTVC